MPCVLPLQSAQAADSVRLLVRSRPGLHAHARQQLFQLHRGRTRREITAIHTAVIEVPRNEASETAAALLATGAVAFVEEDGTVGGDAVVNDPLFDEQWAAMRVNTLPAWTLTTGAAVVVAVVDSGIDASHPEFQGQLLPGWDFVNDDADPADDSGHGTAMAGIISAIADNGTGIAGVAPHAVLLPIKVLDQNNVGLFSDVAAGVVYAVDNGARVINLSLSSTVESPTVQAAVEYAVANDVVVVASAGNAGIAQPVYPAAGAGAVGVAATDFSDQRAGFSNYGPWLSLSAPGVNVYTTYFAPEYTSVTGTSPAAALTSAAFALLRAANPSMTANDAISAMTSQAEDLGALGFDSESGHGLVDIYAALAGGQSSSSRDRRRPEVELLTPQKGNLLDGITAIEVAASDDVGVTRVDIEIDGETYASTNVGPFSFAWDTAGVDVGMHTIRAAAYDAAGNRGRSAVARVFVTDGEGLMLQRAKIQPRTGSADGAVRLKAILRLPPGATFDPAVDAVSVGLTSSAGMVMQMQVDAGTMTIRRSTAQFRGTAAAPADGDVRLQLKPNRVGGTHTLQLSGRELSLGDPSTELDISLAIGSTLVTQSVTLRPQRGDLVLP